MPTTYTREELMADPEFAERIHHDGRLLHGGLAPDGSYLPPRSQHRLDAIEAWAAHLRSEGHPDTVLGQEVIPEEFFPSEEQAKLLLRSGARGAMARILTLIGVVEGFGNDGIKLMPTLDFTDYIVEPIEGTCLAHLHEGLFEAHGNDEAGRGDEHGHDHMWFAVRDAALDRPEILPDYFKSLPVAPPPGYTGPAEAAPDAINVGASMEPLVEGVDPMFELTIRGMATILVIELMAFRTFQWASAVLGDATCSADAEFAARIIGHIRTDEEIHVAYLQTALAELAVRTVRTSDGGTIPGSRLVAEACRLAVETQTGDRFGRTLAFRYGQIREELAGLDDGDRLVAEFDSLGPVPT